MMCFFCLIGLLDSNCYKRNRIPFKVVFPIKYFVICQVTSEKTIDLIKRLKLVEWPTNASFVIEDSLCMMGNWGRDAIWWALASFSPRFTVEISEAVYIERSPFVSRLALYTSYRYCFGCWMGSSGRLIPRVFSLLFRRTLTCRQRAIHIKASSREQLNVVPRKRIV